MKLKEYTMKLSDNALAILKNFAGINNSILVKQGNKLRTISVAKNILAEAEIKEDFPRDFAIYDLNEFLAALSLFEKPELDFKDDFVVITEEGSKGKSLKYWYSDPSVVTSPSKEVTMPSSEIEFNLSSDTLSEVTKAAAVIGVPDMVLESGELRVTDKKNDTANSYSTQVVQSNDEAEKYKFWFKVENLKLLQGSYDVQVSAKKISYFKNSNFDIEYFIALEPESSYGN